VPPDKKQQRSSVAQGFEWASRITAVSLEMVLPGIGGQWLDKQWGTNFLGLLGFALGVSLGILHLLAIAKEAERSRKENSDQGQSKD